MNLKRRITKLEKATNSDGLCACDFVKRTEMFLQDLREDAEMNEPMLSGESVPDVCPQCRKPIDKQQIIIQLCYQTTKERFP
jgi:hypothetical protein